MAQPARIRLLLPLTIAVFLSDCPCHAEGLVGLWRTETNRWSAPGHTNQVEGAETIEFLSDGSFKITDSMVVDGKRTTHIPYVGTYTVVGTNRVSLKIMAQDVPPGVTASTMTVSASIVGNELVIPKFVTSVVPEYKRYRREEK